MDQELKFTGNNVTLTMTLTDKNIIENANRIKKELENGKVELTKNEVNIKTAERNIAIIKENVAVFEDKFKEINHFVEWANAEQLNKAKVIVRDNLEELYKKVESEYTLIDGDSSEVSKTKKNNLLQKKLATLDLTVETIEPSNVKKFFFTEPIFTNPWNPDEVVEVKE